MSAVCPKAQGVAASQLDRSRLIPLKKSALESGRFGREIGRMADPTRSGGCWSRHRDELCEFPQVLGGGGEVEFIAGAVWSSETQPIEPQDALEVSKQHLDLLARPA